MAIENPRDELDYYVTRKFSAEQLATVQAQLEYAAIAAAARMCPECLGWGNLDNGTKRSGKRYLVCTKCGHRWDVPASFLSREHRTFAKGHGHEQ